MKATDETKQAAKAAGIKQYWLKSEETLQEELGEPAPAEEVEVVEELTLPTDVEKKVMIFSIKCVGQRSPYYKYKDILL